MRVKVYDAAGNPVLDKILLRPRSGNEMHPAVAVANVLKIWIAGNAAQCCLAMDGVVVQGEIRPGNRIVVNGKSYRLEHREGGERCAMPRDDKFKEPFWILDPGAPCDVRYLVRTGRKTLSRLTDRVNALCQEPKNAAVCGMKIKQS